jgi:hypothetical protein
MIGWYKNKIKNKIIINYKINIKIDKLISNYIKIYKIYILLWKKTYFPEGKYF